MRAFPRQQHQQQRMFSRDTAREALRQARQGETKTKAPRGRSTAIYLGLGLVGVSVGGTVWLTYTEMGKQAFNMLSEKTNTTMQSFADPDSDMLLPNLPDVEEPFVNKPTLVIDFEDTLVHIEWNRSTGWRAAKRPGADIFLEALYPHYEIVLFSTGFNQFLEEWIVSLDTYRAISHHLYRNSTLFKDGEFIKDLSHLNRDLSKVIIIDDEAERFKLQPENGIAVKPFTDITNTTDNELLDLIPFLTDMAVREVPDLREELATYKGKHIPTEFKRRKQEAKEAGKKKGGLGGLLRRG